MTRQQTAALAFIASYYEANGNSPSFSEINAHLGLKSKSNVHRILEALEGYGFIRRRKYLARSIQIIDPGEVKLNAEIFALVKDYASKEKIGIDTAANELLRSCLSTAA
jgi:repressor LexA